MKKEEAKEEVKRRLEEYLRARGIDTRRKFKCLNPQHNDEHPSMSYDEKRQIVHCFSCGVNYDTLNVMEIETGLRGYELFKHAYEYFGIEVEGNSRERAYKPQEASMSGQGISKYLKECEGALKGSEGEKYLHERGYTDETLKICQHVKMQGMVERDPMTGLYSKTHSNYLVNQTVSESSALNALLVLDMDNFKQVNDKLGHLIGDAVILDVALSLKRLFRKTDILGHIGGDEFMVLMKDLKNTDIVDEKCRQLRDFMRRNYTQNNETVSVSASIGIALAPKHGTDFKTLFSHADAALYQVKRKGKDNHLIYESGFIDNRIIKTNNEKLHSQDYQQLLSNPSDYIDKLKYMRFSMDLKDKFGDDAAINRRGKKYRPVAIEKNLLVVSILKMKSVKNGKILNVYRVDQISPIFKYAEELKQITSWKTEYMRVPVRRTMQNALLCNYLLVKISLVKNDSNKYKNNGILFQTIFEDLKLDVNTRHKTKNIRDTVKQMFDFWLKIGLLTSYKFEKKGTQFYKISFTVKKNK